jgi:hypothetical protein
VHIGELLRQWDKLAEGGKKGTLGTEGDGWFGKDGWVWYDCLPCEWSLFRTEQTLRTHVLTTLVAGC